MPKIDGNRKNIFERSYFFNWCKSVKTGIEILSYIIFGISCILNILIGQYLLAFDQFIIPFFYIRIVQLTDKNEKYENIIRNYIELGNVIQSIIKKEKNEKGETNV